MAEGGKFRGSGKPKLGLPPSRYPATAVLVPKAAWCGRQAGQRRRKKNQSAQPQVGRASAPNSLRKPIGTPKGGRSGDDWRESWGGIIWRKDFRPTKSEGGPPLGWLAPGRRGFCKPTGMADCSQLTGGPISGAAPRDQETRDD